jgi:hypothetical protein
MGEGVPPWARRRQAQGGMPAWSMEKNVDRLPKPRLKTIFSVRCYVPLGTALYHIRYGARDEPYSVHTS